LFSLGYRIPFYAYGDSLEFIYGKSTVNTPNLPGSGSALGVVGKGDVAGLRWNHYLPRDGERTGKIVYGVDYKHIDTSCTLEGLNSEQVATSINVCNPYTTRPLSVTYVGQQASAGQQIDYNIGLVRNWGMGAAHQNVDVNGNSTENDRYSYLTPGHRTSKDNFMILRSGASIFKGWENDWQMRLAAVMQYSPYAIVSSEQLGLVGSTAVRGFDERAVSADSGLVANAEVYTPELAARLGIPGNLRMLGFYDIATGYNSHLGGGVTPAVVNVASIGFGGRYGIGKDFNVRADMAKIINTGNAANEQRGNWRAHISAVLGF
jgi:hemolysin activation/secretion protein